MNIHRRTWPSRLAALLIVSMSVLAAGCSGGDQPGLPAGGGSAETAPGDPDVDGDDADAGAEGAGAANGGSGGTNLVWNECPIDADRAPAVIQLIMDVTGYEVIDDGWCRFTDGVRLVTFLVLGNNDDIIDHRQPFVERGYRITELDRGENGFLAVGELEAHAQASFGDLALTLGMSSLELDHTGYERLARGLMDVAVGE